MGVVFTNATDFQVNGKVILKSNLHVSLDNRKCATISITQEVLLYIKIYHFLQMTAIPTNQSANPNQFGAGMGDVDFREQEEEWEREGLLDPAWEKQQRKVICIMPILCILLY